MGTEEVRDVARRLARLVERPGRVSGRAAGREPVRAVLGRFTRERWGARRGRPTPTPTDTPWRDAVWRDAVWRDAVWRDAISPGRPGWHRRSVDLDGVCAFVVDYRICGPCGIGWVEDPHTQPEYQRRGLASAGLAALRAEHRGLRWHTAGGHLPDARPFWAVVGAGVPGGYRPRRPCGHLLRQG